MDDLKTLFRDAIIATNSKKKIEYERRREEGAMEMFLDIIEIYKTSNNQDEVQIRIKPIIEKLKEKGYWEEKYEDNSKKEI